MTDTSAREPDDFSPEANQPTPKASKRQSAQPNETAPDRPATLIDQASDKARSLASQGKDKATDALGDASRFLEDAARTVEDKFGAQYGGYARTAASSVSGFADSLKNKDVDELVDDARELVRKSPAIAIGAAAAVGFLFARLLKSGAGYEERSGPSDRDA